jgi:hypothetical protein
MERAIFLVDNLTLAQACVAFAEQLGLNVEPEILSRLEENHYLTTGSKNYDVNFIKNESFAEKKAAEADIFISCISEDYIDFLQSCVTESENKRDEDEITLSDEDDVNTPDSATISALYAKVKGQKKSPANYYITWRNDQWVATTSLEGAYGNLAILYSLN